MPSGPPARATHAGGRRRRPDVDAGDPFEQHLQCGPSQSHDESATRRDPLPKRTHVLNLGNPAALETRPRTLPIVVASRQLPLKGRRAGRRHPGPDHRWAEESRSSRVSSPRKLIPVLAKTFWRGSRRGSGAEEQFGGDVPVGQTLGDERRDLGLLRSESDSSGGVAFAGGLAGPPELLFCPPRPRAAPSPDRNAQLFADAITARPLGDNHSGVQSVDGVSELLEFGEPPFDRIEVSVRGCRVPRGRRRSRCHGGSQSGLSPEPHPSHPLDDAVRRVAEAARAWLRDRGPILARSGIGRKCAHRQDCLGRQSGSRSRTPSDSPSRRWT